MLAFKTKMISFHYTIILLLLFNLNGENGAQEMSCSTTREQNKIVNIKKSREISATTRAIKGLNLTDENLCKQRCCESQDCTIYVYYNSQSRQFNCFLIHCSPESNCVRSNLDGSFVGVMKRDTDNSIQPSQVTTHQFKQGVTLETSITQTSIGAVPTVMEQPAQREMASPTSGRSSSPTGTPQASLLASTHQLTSVNPSTKPTHATPTSQTKNQSMTTKKETTTANTSATKHNHTTKSSLVIALFFGILFLCAVIIIVGKPWWEFMQRPRYSKVDYLMNGI